MRLSPIYLSVSLALVAGITCSCESISKAPKNFERKELEVVVHVEPC